MGRKSYGVERHLFVLRQLKPRHVWYAATAKLMGLSTNEFLCRVLAQFHVRAENLEIKQLKEVFKHGDGK